MRTFRRGTIAWDTIAYAILALVVMVVLIIIFTNTNKQSGSTVRQCKGLLDFGDFKGVCKPAPCADGETQASLFGAGCSEDQVCCIVKSEGNP